MTQTESVIRQQRFLQAGRPNYIEVTVYFRDQIHCLPTCRGGQSRRLQDRFACILIGIDCLISVHLKSAVPNVSPTGA